MSEASEIGKEWAKDYQVTGSCEQTNLWRVVQ